jgi:hypothetical protein
VTSIRQFYTYLWLREDGTPYYVGKGKGDRAIRRGSPSLDRILIQEFPSEADAFAAEIFLISFYGRKDIGTGILRNRTIGGDGGDTFSGREHKPETLAKMRKPKPEGFGIKISAAHTGAKRSADARRRMSIKAKARIPRRGWKHSAETIEKISQLKKARDAERMLCHTS